MDRSIAIHFAMLGIFWSFWALGRSGKDLIDLGKNLGDFGKHLGDFGKDLGDFSTPPPARPTR